MAALDEKELSSINGGRLREADEASITDWFRLNKDMGSDFNSIMQKMEEDYMNKVEYHDLIDTDGKPVSLTQFRIYCRNIWDTIS